MARDRSPMAPQFRPLEVQRVERAGQHGLVLSDPVGIATQQVFVPAALLPIVRRFDGERSIAAIESELRAEGAELPEGFVADLVAQLDAALLLESPRARQAELAHQRAFLEHPSGARPCRHAGSAGYPAEPERLQRRLQKLVPRPTTATLPPPRGLIAPHIDVQRGEAGYAAAYGYLARCAPADLYVVFGTGHKGPSAPVTGLALDWDTPLGRVPTDRGFVARVHAALGPAAPRDAFLHRDEHSLEFQMLMLRHVLGDRPFAVAGFLCGQLPTETGDPTAEPYLAPLLDAFTAAARASGQRVCYVAGADLAHLGPFFGDAEPVTPALLERLARDDRARLAHLVDGAAGAFHGAVEGCGNPDRLCGTTPMFLTAMLAGGRAELLHYGQADARDGSQVVTFCSMAFAG